MLVAYTKYQIITSWPQTTTIYYPYPNPCYYEITSNWKFQEPTLRHLLYQFYSILVYLYKDNPYLYTYPKIFKWYVRSVIGSTLEWKTLAVSHTGIIVLDYAFNWFFRDLESSHIYWCKKIQRVLFKRSD